MPTSVGMTDGVNRRICINGDWYKFRMYFEKTQKLNSSSARLE
jgi:hypothetical protein